MERVIAGVMLALAGLPAMAQDWRVDLRDDGSYLHGTATLAGDLVSLWCVAPSPQGRDPLSSEAYLVEPMAPYAIRILADAAFVAAPGQSRVDAIIGVDGGVFSLPMTVFGEEEAHWSVDIAMAEPLIAAALGTAKLTASMAGRAPVSLGTNGLNAALNAAMSHCIGGWQTAGYPLPAGLGLSVAAPRNPTLPAGNMAAPNGAGAILMTMVDRHILQGCGSTYAVDPGYLQGAEVDGDGIDDLLIDWNHISCQGASPRPFCGAANCSASVFLSQSTPAKGEPEEAFGTSHGFVPLSNGRMAVSSSFHAGAQGTFEVLMYWDGLAFVELETGVSR
jgi:hypothetical protein